MKRRKPTDLSMCQESKEKLQFLHQRIRAVQVQRQHVPPETAHKTNYFRNHELEFLLPHGKCDSGLNSLCSHEEHLNDAVQVARVAQVHKSRLPRLRFPGELQQPRDERVRLRSPGTLVQHVLDLFSAGFREILEQYKCVERVKQRCSHHPDDVQTHTISFIS